MAYLRQLQVKCTEHDRPLYMVFVEFCKAFYTVGRTGLWQLLRKYGCPEKFPTRFYIAEWQMLVLEGKSKKFGLKINTKKTDVLYQPNSTRTREEDIINFKDAFVKRIIRMVKSYDEERIIFDWYDIAQSLK